VFQKPAPDESEISGVHDDDDDLDEEDDLAQELLAAEEDMAFLEILQALVNGGADLHATDSRGYTALHFACEHGHLPTIRYLLEQKVDINATSKYVSQ
jgi:ankyrin repeat protein